MRQPPRELDLYILLCELVSTASPIRSQVGTSDASAASVDSFWLGAERNSYHRPPYKSSYKYELGSKGFARFNAFG